MVEITIDAALQEKVNEFGDAINITEICNQALASKVVSLNQAREGNSGSLDAIAERLLAEAQTDRDEDYNFGFTVGYAMAKSSSHRELVKALHYAEEIDEHIGNLSRSNDEHIGNLSRSNKDNLSMLVWGMHRFDDLDSEEVIEILDRIISAESYLRGYYAGITKFWNDIREKL